MGLTSLLLATLFVAPPVPPGPDTEPGVGRDAYGDSLPFGAVARYGTLRYRAGYPGCVAFSRDNKTMISAGGGNKLHFWDTATGKLVREYEAFTSSNQQFAVSPDGKRVVTGNADEKALTLRDLATGTVLRRFAGLQHSPDPVRISPDGKFVAACVPQADQVIVWDTATGKELVRYRMNPFRLDRTYYPHPIAFSGDGKYLAAGNVDVLVLDLATRKPVSALRGRGDTLGTIAFSPDSSRVMTAGKEGGRVRVWDRAGEKEIREVATGIAGRLALSRDGKTAFGDDEEGRLTAWDLETGKRIYRSATRVRSTGLALSPDETHVAKWYDSAIAVHDARTGKCLNPPAFPESNFGYLAFSPDGKSLALACTSSSEQDVRLWTFRAGVVSAPPRLGFGRPGAVCVNERREVLVYAQAPKGGIEIWNVTAGRKIAALPEEKGGFRAVFATNQTLYASGDELIRWDTSANRVERRIPLPEESRNSELLVSGDGRVLLTAGSGAAATWSAATGERLSTMTLPINSAARAISPDGKRFVTDDRGGTRLRDTRTGAVVLEFGGRYTPGVAFSPDGRLIAVADGAGAIQLWDAKTLGKVRRVVGHRAIARVLLFSPDSRYLASSSADSTALVWDVRKLAPGGK